MFKQTTLLFFVLLATQALGSHIKIGKYPKVVHTMKQQAYQQLQLLRSAVDGEVAATDHKLDDLRQQTINYQIDVLDNGGRKIEAEGQKQLDNFNVLKNLAESIGLDISYCIYRYESPIENLPKYLVNELEVCLFSQINELDAAIKRTRNNIAALARQVDDIEAELNLCGDDEANCLGPIILTIQNAQEEIPEQIDIEADRVKPVVESLQVSMDQCSSSKVADCTSRGNQILNDFQNCVNASSL